MLIRRGNVPLQQQLSLTIASLLAAAMCRYFLVYFCVCFFFDFWSSLELSLLASVPSASLSILKVDWLISSKMHSRLIMSVW